jgi:DNA (cytosine-5)-methyltransferase 1
MPQSHAVLKAQFGGVEYFDNITNIRSLPGEVDCITAGFPCQDLSQAGRTAGLDGGRSGLIGEVFRLLRQRRVSTVVVENVPFMLQLGGGSAIRAIIEEFERLGYRWAYRIVDSFSFGLPQRRERVFLVASRELDPASVLLVDDHPFARPENAFGKVGHGFYWTEGFTGLGWAVDAVPTLKNGSTVGIASPPAVLMPNGEIVKPSIEDAEALQGFPRGWTAPALGVVKPGYRWGLVGSAVSVPVAEWVGSRLLNPGCYDAERDRPFPLDGKCARAARFDGKTRWAVNISPDPLGIRPPHIVDFLQGPFALLSLNATSGFYSRTQRARLRFAPDFISAVQAHIVRMGGVLPQTLQHELALAA